MQTPAEKPGRNPATVANDLLNRCFSRFQHTFVSPCPSSVPWLLLVCLTRIYAALVAPSSWNLLLHCPFSNQSHEECSYILAADGPHLCRHPFMSNGTVIAVVG